MKAVVIDQYFPDVNRDSGSIDTVNYVNALADLGYEVYLSALVPDLSFENDFNTKINIIESNGLGKWIFDNCNEIYVIIIFRYTTASAVIDVIENFCLKAKKIFFTSDLHFLREERALAIGKTNNKNTFNIRKTEIDLMYRFDCTIVVSTYEEKVINSIDNDINIKYIPIERGFIGTSKSWYERPKKVGFIGGYNHTPNIDAVENIINNILPHLRKLDPNIKIVLAGSNMPDSLKKLQVNGIEQIGFIENLSHFFDDLRCSIAPLRFGAGQKGKVLSSLAHGLPVISSSIGAEGISSNPKEMGIVIEDDPQKFAEAITSICNSADLFNTHSKNAINFGKSENQNITKKSLNEIINFKSIKVSNIKADLKEKQLSVLLLTRSLSSANMSIIQSWTQQISNNSKAELIILAGESSPIDESILINKNIIIYKNSDAFQRIKWGLSNSNGNFIQFASDDDAIQIEKVNNLIKFISDSNENTTLINDYIAYGKFGSSIYHQNFQYYAGTERYTKFCGSMGAIPAYYSCFPKDVVSKWIIFLESHNINHPYSDWLLLLCAFLHSEYKYIGKHSPPDMYNIDNWNGHFQSEKTLINHLIKNNNDIKLFPFLDLLWMFHSYMLINEVNLENEATRNELVAFIWQFFISRFNSNFSSRCLMAGLSNEEISLLKYFSSKINSDKLNFKTAHDCLLGAASILNKETSLKILNSINSNRL
jgi:glycosyltransferase involved in cell wall biosynthesis